MYDALSFALVIMIILLQKYEKHLGSDNHFSRK